MFKLNATSKRNISKRKGMSVQSISDMSSDEIDARIEKRTGKKIRIEPPRKIALLGRGSVYISLNRLIPFGKVDKKLAKM